MATKINLTVNSKFTYQGKEFLPGDKIQIINREDAIKLLTIGFIVGDLPKESPATTPKKEEGK